MPRSRPTHAQPSWSMGVLFAMLLLCPLVCAHARPPRLDPTTLSLDVLLTMEIVSVSKRAEPARTTPAAIVVLTADDLRRSGATSLPEALRLAPGVQVARVNASQWAIGIRGFANTLSRGLLVLVDGRSVYSPLDAGVFWDVVQPPIETIARIEVIRGPGGTVWGANAVNGVINVITKAATETAGGMVSLHGGTSASVRGFAQSSGQVSPTLTYRGYGTAFLHGGDIPHQGTRQDGWRLGQAGARLDWALSDGEALTIQGDLYSGTAGRHATTTFLAPPGRAVTRGEAALSGGNLLARWRHSFSPTSDLAVQAYYDRSERRELRFQDLRDTGDLDLQHRFALPWRQDVSWGFGVHLSSGFTRADAGVSVRPRTRTEQVWRAAVQDTVTLWPERLTLTVGTKVEHNDYSGWEWQPTVRAVWTPTEPLMFWGAVTRAVRTPSRLEHDLGIQNLVRLEPLTLAEIVPDTQFRAESLLAYEAGVRATMTPQLLVDVTLFYNVHQHLLSVERGTPFVSTQPVRHLTLPVRLRNGVSGTSAGLEALVQWQVLPWWRLTATYSYLGLWLRPTAGSLDTTTAAATRGNSPRHLGSVRSAWTLVHGLEADLVARYMDALPAQAVGSYVTLDARLGWQATRALSLALVGTNLLTPQHPEWAAGEPLASEVPRSVSGEVTWKW